MFAKMLSQSFAGAIYKKEGGFGGLARFLRISSTSCRILSSILLSRLGPYIDEITVYRSVGFDITDRLQINFLHSSDSREKMGAQ